MMDKKVGLLVDGASDWVAAATLASKTDVVAVSSSGVGTTGKALAAVGLLSAVAMIGFQRPQLNQLVSHFSFSSHGISLYAITWV